MMNRFQFQQVESLFEIAVGFDAPARQMFLDRIAREHSREIRDMVERLLVCDRSRTLWSGIGSPLAEPSAVPEPEPSGTVLDRFELIERLGVGGHGEVYLADQLRPVRRRVALKMVRLGAATSQVIDRFRAEQQALAVMSHPGIAAVYEAGLADQGRLFFAMEYVPGQPIDAYSDSRRLSVRERLHLFIKICQAVQHAHQKGLIHRDLKPSNILVAERDGAAMPVLIDFGIAVATASADRDPATRGAAMGTPAYMSPEQAGASPSDIDTRADIYALGIVLYEMLTGRTPLDALAPAGASLAELRRCILEGSPPAPAALLETLDETDASAATDRRCTPKQLRRQVTGDLDAVVRRAIARNREDRYQTAEALADDVEKHLDHRPVSAGATSAVMRARKFIRRHRLTVGAACGLATLLFVGIAGVTLAMLRAEHADRESRAINSFLTDLLTSSRPLEKGSTVSFVEVLKGGSTMAADRFSDYPRQEGEVRYLIGHTYFMLGMNREARAELERSLTLLRESRGMDDVKAQHAASLLAMTLVSQRRLDEAQSLAEEVLSHASGKPMPMRERFLAAQRILCDIQNERGDAKAAESGLRALIPQIDAELGATHIEAYNARMTLLLALRRQTRAGLNEPSSVVPYDEEIALMRETVQLQRQRFGAEDAYPLLSAQLKLSQLLLEQRRFAEAREIAQPLLPRIRDRFGTKHWMYGEAAIALTDILYASGDHQAAADLYCEALEAWRSTYPPDHVISISVTRDALPYLDAAGRTEVGLREARNLLATLTNVLGPNDFTTLEARGWVARFCSLSGSLDEADEQFAALKAHEEALRTDAVGGLVTMFHAGHLARRGRYEEAEGELLELSERQGGVANGVHTHFPDGIARMFIEVYSAWGKPEKAQEYQEIVRSIWDDQR